MKYDNSSDDSFGDYDSDFDDASPASSHQQAASSSEIVAVPLAPEVINAYASVYFEFSLRILRKVKDLDFSHMAASSASADSSSTSTYGWNTRNEAIEAILTAISEDLKTFVLNDKMLDKDAATIIRLLTPRLINLMQQSTAKIVEIIREAKSPVKKQLPPGTPTPNTKNMNNSLARSATKTPRSANPNQATSLTARSLDFKHEPLIASAPDEDLENDAIAPAFTADLLATDVSTQPSSSPAFDHINDLQSDNIDIFASTVDQGFFSEIVSGENADELSDFEPLEIAIQAYFSNLSDPDENTELSVAPTSEMISASSLSMTPESETISALADNRLSTSTLSSRSPSPTQAGLFAPSTPLGNSPSPSSSSCSLSSTQTALLSTPPTTDSAAHAASGSKEEYFKSTLALWKQREREGFDYSARPHPSLRSVSPTSK